MMLTRERHSLIIERLRTDGRVLAAVLAEELSVSEDTIRRDLRALHASGLCERVYGGALATEVAPLRTRTAVGSEIKDRLGARAARLVSPGSFIFLDAGSTNLAIAAALPVASNLTVSTNAPAIAALLYDRPGISVVLVGGRVDPYAGGCIGAEAVASISRLRPDMAFIGACAVDADNGLTAVSYEEMLVKTAVTNVSGTVVVAVASEKIGKSAAFQVCSAQHVDKVVTERQNADILAIERIGVSVVYTETDDD